MFIWASERICLCVWGKKHGFDLTLKEKVNGFIKKNQQQQQKSAYKKEEESLKRSNV